MYHINYELVTCVSVAYLMIFIKQQMMRFANSHFGDTTTSDFATAQSGYGGMGAWHFPVDRKSRNCQNRKCANLSSSRFRRDNYKKSDKVAATAVNVATGSGGGESWQLLECNKMLWAWP